MACQVSRRLARKLSESLRKRRFGFAKLVAHAYMYLLAKLPPDDSALLARELVCQEAVRPPIQEIVSEKMPQKRNNHSIYGPCLTQEDQRSGCRTTSACCRLVGVVLPFPAEPACFPAVKQCI